MDPRGIYDSQVQNETSSDEFVLHPRLPSLQEMSYNQIAIAVWYSYRSTPSQRQFEPSHLESIEKLELMDCHKLIKTLTIPQFMKEILKKYLKRVRQETLRCSRYFRNELLPMRLYEYRIRQMDWEYFVWCPDGRIDYKGTAIKMLHSGVLTEVQKFAIMCDFCLENEIKVFDLNHLPAVETIISKVHEYRRSLLFYWICCLKNDLRRITPFISIDSPDRFRLIYYSSHGAAFEYFWNRLNAEDQSSFISRRLHAFDCSDWRRSLFYKMSHDQLTNLLFREPIATLCHFIGGREMPEWAIMAWKRCKNRISNEQFFELLKNLLNDRYYKNRLLYQERHVSVLLEIWNTANDKHKNYAARQSELEKSVVHLILSEKPFIRPPIASDDAHFWKKLAPSSFKFLLKFLSLKSADFRKNLILVGDLSFIFNFDFSVVREILELCLPNFQGGEVEFKNERSKDIIRPYFCKILYSEDDHDELNRRLLLSFQNLNISSNDVLKKFIETLIAANKRESETYYPSNGNDESDLIRLSKFINKILQEDVSRVLNMKQSYISSFSANVDPYERYGSLNELSKLIEQEFVHEHLQELKHRLAMKLQRTSVEEWVWYVYKYEKFTRVFSWCFENNEELFLQVKRCIPINNIVGMILEGIARISLCSFHFITWHFNNLERFLEWYFSGVAEKAISFKLDIMNDPENAKILEYVQEHRLNLPLRGKFLQWNWPV